MPTYDYDCDSCGHNFELFQSISEPPAEKCPTCGGTVRRRIHGGVGLIFKGTGFYLTDYKKAANASADGKSETGEKKSAGDEKAKSEEAKPSNDKASDKSPGEGTKNSSKK
ncbi:MAG: FmdB family zinc ribbon protein [bacterium]